MAENPNTPNINYAALGLNLDSTESQRKPGELTYALNAQTESFDGITVTYQNEQANVGCITFPFGYRVIGAKNIVALDRVVYFLSDNTNSLIGYVDNDDCTFQILIDDTAGSTKHKLNFKWDHPIHKIIPKTTNCSTQIYWTDGFNPRRFLDFDDLPWVETQDPNNDYKRIKQVNELDSNKMLVQPNFAVPSIEPLEVVIGGSLKMGTYQFAVQYSNSKGDGYTSYYNMSNPLGIYEETVGLATDGITSKAIKLNIQGLDTSGLYEFFNLAVAKTVNGITSFELVGTFPIPAAKVNDKVSTFTYTYTGNEVGAIQLAAGDIFEKFPYYDIAGDVFEVDNVLGWDDLKSEDEINYQQVWSNVKLNWETHRIPYTDYEGYNNGTNTATLRGYMRDEVYAFEGVFILKNGKETRAFHIPGRQATAFDREIISNNDTEGRGPDPCEEEEQTQRWQVYNTGKVIDYSLPYKNYTPDIITKTVPKTGPTISGNMAFICDDEDCTEQGNMAVRITLSAPAPSGGVTVEIGFIEEDARAFGWDLFTVPGGVTALPANMQPYKVFIPGGISTIDVEFIQKPGGFHWTCQTCLAPISDVYFRVPCGKANFTVSMAHTIDETPDDDFDPDNQEPVTPQPRVHNLSDECEGEVVTIIKDCYKGPYQYGEFGYWESTLEYPKSQVFGNLKGKIRHHKMPDSLITHIHDNSGMDKSTIRSYEHYIFPIGVRVDMATLYQAIENSNLTAAQKDQIIGFKIVRGNRATNKSVVAKGLFNNVGQSTYGGQTDSVVEKKTFYYPNYPFNDLRRDPYYTNNDRMTGRNFTTYMSTDKHLGYQPDVRLDGFNNEDSHERMTFHSPDTHFFQPRLTNNGSFLKVETIEYGMAFSNFVTVLDNAEYKFLTKSTIEGAAALGVVSTVTVAGGNIQVVVVGIPIPTFNMASAVPTYLSTMDLFNKLAPYTNFGYNFNSTGFYGNFYSPPNEGDKVRTIEFNKYLADGFEKVEGDHEINNIRRESSIYIKTNIRLPFPHEYDNGIPTDESRYHHTSGPVPDDNGVRSAPIASYYGSIKRYLPDQWGSLYSYETIDTGHYQPLKKADGITKFDQARDDGQIDTVFGGDIFINRFAYKTKLPFFRQNTVSADNQTDIEYDELGNLNYPMFWLSTRPARLDMDLEPQLSRVKSSIFTIAGAIGNLTSLGVAGSEAAFTFVIKLFSQIFEKLGIANINLNQEDTDATKGIIETGKMYLFAYGIPYYFVESEVNVDYRQATNRLEGDFYPHVGGLIPNDWLQEKNVSIANDNVYYYNQTYSKQNKENHFVHLGHDWDPTKLCLTQFPNRAIWSDKSSLEETKNNWLVYRAGSYFDLPKAYGQLTSIDSIENRQLVVRMENKSQLYNALTTVQVSDGPAAYLGNTQLFSGAPPLDLSDTELGHSGSQHKLFIKTEFGHIFVDALRGNVLLLQGNQVKRLSDKGMNKWFAENLPFKISKGVPGTPTDNHFSGIGLHGVFDNFYQRFILTKLDYEYLGNPGAIEWRDGAFYPKVDFIQEGEVLSPIPLTDINTFCNKSWSISYCFKTGSWISFHSYTPNYYVAHPKYFQSGILPTLLPSGDLIPISVPGYSSTLWNHNSTFTEFQRFYGKQYPYILEYPFVYKQYDEILQDVRDYSSALKYTSYTDSYEPDEHLYFNKAIIYNRQQTTGVRNLVAKPRNSLASYRLYPKHNTDSIDIIVTKSDNFYNFNMLWDIVKDHNKPFFETGCDFTDNDKSLILDNIDYGLRSHKKATIRAKDCRVRLILDDKYDFKLVSRFILTDTQPSL